MKTIIYNEYFDFWKQDIINELKNLKKDKDILNIFCRTFNYFFNKKINNISKKLSTLDFQKYQFLVTDKFYYMNKCQLACPFNLNKASLIFSKYLLKFKSIDKTEKFDFPSFSFLMKVNPYVAKYFLKELCKRY